jgi:formylmethanofuran dehydrogenase subunit E
MAKCDKCGEVANIRIYGIDYCAFCALKIFNSNTILKEDKKEDKIMETYICKECERKFTNDETYRIGDIDDIYCEECADKLFEKCCDCEEYINHNKEKYYLYNGNKICHTCFINYYDKCYHCEEVINEEDYYVINGRIVCQNCLDNHYSKCECCDEYYETDNGYWTNDDNFVCCNCYNNEYFTCIGCDSIFHEDNLYTYNDYCYCEDCYNKINAIIHSWNYKPNNITFHGNKDRINNLHVGIELEIQGSG